MSKVRAIFRTSAFVGFSTALLAAFETRRVLTPEARKLALVNRYRTRLSNGVLRLFGTELLVRGKREYPHGALVVANHQSALDIGVMLALFQAVLVSRHEVADWPLLGRMAKHGDTIFVDRADRRSGVTALREIRKRAKEGRTVVAFPEGATFPGDSVHEFHPGTFAAVQSLHVPIIPVGLAYSPAVHYGQDSFAQHLAKIASSERTRVAVFFGEPLRAELDSRAAAEAARTQVERLVVEARRALEDDSA